MIYKTYVTEYKLDTGVTILNCNPEYTLPEYKIDEKVETMLSKVCSIESTVEEIKQYVKYTDTDSSGR